jgi:CBS domain-containing protein
MAAAWNTLPMLGASRKRETHEGPTALGARASARKIRGMSGDDCKSPRIPSSQALEMTVGEVMIDHPKTLSPEVSVGDVRRAFERASQRTVLLAENGIFRGAIERDGLPADAAEQEPAMRYAETQLPTATPEMPVVQALAMLEQRDEPRLIVLDEDGVSLRGLVCFNRTASGFCRG